MSTPSAVREQALVTAFVRLADTLVADYDVIELFHALCGDCVALLGADAAGLLLTDQRGALQVVSASTEAANLVELFQLQAEEGPCLDCFRTSAQVHAGDLATDTRWPRFAALADDNGFTAVHALPMRLRGETIGALNLFHRNRTDMSVDELAIGQALADVATIAILSDRNTRERERLTEQLQAALTSRVIIEQAKGVLAERGQIPLDEAFTRLRSHARSTQQRLSDLARAVTDGSLDTTPLLR
ncbi:GAF and ANTAR domain-containing protein [Actinomycetospora chibensis]|uniref:GAF and ANTAR domain-containing protein n=1 Tax=Actinomycetospora chibensis TaxID=663606 RepID=A0ABV9RM65_9PSEU|nr:GAF and ANTAR domain-containing protein [Actinomycetospora chibensis]MDD7923059.1 GAF and ANTAR domain-containing protein [Actinomycetospora chibensis]